MQILGYRHHEVAGISPWTVIEGGPLDENNYLYQAHKYAYQPIAAYCHDYDTRFYDGEGIVRRVEVFNDVLEPSNLHLRWKLTVAEETVDRGQETLELGPGDHRMLNIQVRPRCPKSGPSGVGRLPGQWHLALDRQGKMVFGDTHDWAIFRRQPPPKLSHPVGLYDPKGEVGPLFDGAGIACTTISSLADLDKTCEVLVIAPGTLVGEKNPTPKIGYQAPGRKALTGFIRQGGRLLLLRQKHYPSGLFDVTPTGRGSTMTFAVRSDHPALAGIEADDLKFWRGDHMVSDFDLQRPLSGGSRALVVAGSAAGINTTPLLERPIGRGSVMCCQMRLVEKYQTEPVAARILHNLLGYLDSYKARAAMTGVIGMTPEYRTALRTLGLRCDELASDGTKAELSRYSLVICRGSLGNADGLRQFVEEGGNLFVHRPTAETMARLRTLFEVKLADAPYTGPVQRAEGDDPLQQAITREDLYWLGEHVGISWSETPRALEMADGIFSKTLDEEHATSYEVEQWTLSGQIVERREPGVTFATVGVAVTGNRFSRCRHLRDRIAGSWNAL